MLKILCAGMNRTGTSSLHVALKKLGYNSVHSAQAIIDFYNPPDNWDIFGEVECVFEPFWFFWREIHQQHRCKLILTIRDADRWFDSLSAHQARHGAGTRESNMALWGCGYPNRRRWTSAFRRHAASILNSTPVADLLVLRVCDGDGWGPLCKFLDKDIPDAPFPNIP